MDIKKESDLYEPLKQYFENMGFKVYAEIEDCDIAAVKDDIITIVEMKKQFSLKLIYQAMERKFITENVYVAIPRPKNFKDKETKCMRRLLKELNLGLITVYDMGGECGVQIISVPEPLGRKNKSKKRNKLLSEIQGRQLNLNKGGVNKTKILTAYKERSIFLVCIAEKFGNITTDTLKNFPEYKKYYSVLSRNFFGWFERIERGTYKLTEKGTEILKCEDFSEAIRFYRDKTAEISTNQERKQLKCSK